MKSYFTNERMSLGLSLLKSNPSLLLKALWKKALVSAFPPKHLVTKRMNGVLFEFDFDLAPGIVRSMYIGTYEIDMAHLLQKFLQPGDTFIDVGANIGYITAFGAGRVGKSGQVHSFEPVPLYFQRLDRFRRLNPDYAIEVNAFALGETPGTACISVDTGENIGWNTLVPSFADTESSQQVEVSVVRLDDYIREKALDRIRLIKVDTEGFEFPVLKGLQGYLDSTSHRPLILCEISPGAYHSLGSSLDQFDQYLKRYGYRVFNIHDLRQEVDLKTISELSTVLFKPADSS
jgi:FkbM family methyltransferase